MIVTDLVSLLIYLASGAASAGVSKLFEKFEWFQALAPNGKMASVIGASAILAIVAVFLQGVVAQNPFISTAVDPYIKALLPLVNLFATQITHGSAKATMLRALRSGK